MTSAHHNQEQPPLQFSNRTTEILHMLEEFFDSHEISVAEAVELNEPFPEVLELIETS